MNDILSFLRKQIKKLKNDVAISFLFLDEGSERKHDEIITKLKGYYELYKAFKRFLNNNFYLGSFVTNKPIYKKFNEYIRLKDYGFLAFIFSLFLKSFKKVDKKDYSKLSLRTEYNWITLEDAIIVDNKIIVIFYNLEDHNQYCVIFRKEIYNLYKEFLKNVKKRIKVKFKDDKVIVYDKEAIDYIKEIYKKLKNTENHKE